ncbi:MAG: DinB family protein [Planctomycetota bacterium]|nr:DinB family protein [Planctomycetota bacterium]
MDHLTIATRLAAAAEVIRSLVEDISAEEARWKPAPKKWSILEVVSHLADEERDDFRKRLDLTLHHPGEEWPPIDPEGWVVDRRYDERDFGAALEGFLDERRRSVAWLRALEAPAWTNAYENRRFTLSAGDLLHSWLAHDLQHIRQLVRLRYERLKNDAEPFSVDYAG